MLLQILDWILKRGIIILIFDLYCVRSSWCSPIPCVVVDTRCGVLLPGSALRDGYTHVLGLSVRSTSRRRGVTLASCCGSGNTRLSRRPCGQLLRQRQSVLSRLYASLA